MIYHNSINKTGLCVVNKLFYVKGKVLYIDSLGRPKGKIEVIVGKYL